MIYVEMSCEQSIICGGGSNLHNININCEYCFLKLVDVPLTYFDCVKQYNTYNEYIYSINRES